MTEKDHSLPILGQEEASDPWDLPRPTPTTLLGLFDYPTAPGFDAVKPGLVAAFGDRLAFEGEPPERPFHTEWAEVLTIDGHPTPLIMWSEPITSESLQAPPFAEHARCMVAVQSMLDPNDPLGSWKMMAETLGCLSADPVALFDLETEQWFNAEETLNRIIGADAIPEEGMLFRIHATSTSQEPAEDDPVWLRTAGLQRCGRPEIEMLEVRGGMLGIAHDLVEAVGSLCILRGAPDPGEPFDAGVNVELSLQPLAGQLELLPEESVGTWGHRVTMGGTDEPENPFLAGRAVLCGAEPRGSVRRIHTWPEDTLQRLLRGEAGLERTENWTNSIAREAQRRWPILLQGVDDGHVAEVCVGLESDTGGREQVWVALVTCDGSGVTGRLLSTPSQVSSRIGDIIEAPLSDVIDWRLMQAGGSAT